MLLPTKTEITAIAELLAEGADGPEGLAKAVIRRLTELRGAREQHFAIVELSPGVYTGEGPYPTRAAAKKAATKNLWITEFGRRWAVVPVNGQEHNLQREAEADARPPTERGDWAEIALDRQAFKAGWRGKQVDRKNFLQP